jgi:hypothetical protein
VWRSREEIAENRLGLVALGRTGVAFQHDHQLYMAPLGGVERPVASRELPLGWTTGGLYTYSYPRRELLLRADTGVILRSIGRQSHEYEFDRATGSLYFLSDRVLMGARGVRTWRLGTLTGLGISASSWVQPIGGLVELLDARRLVLVRPDGSPFASTSVRDLDRISSFLAVAPAASAVAFTGVTGRTGNLTAENVYLLRAGTRAAIAVHHELGSFRGCAQWASVQWHGSWLLYADNSGQLGAIDTAGPPHAIELTGLVRRLLRGQEVLSARWSGSPAR